MTKIGRALGVLGAAALVTAVLPALGACRPAGRAPAGCPPVASPTYPAANEPACVTPPPPNR